MAVVSKTSAGAVEHIPIARVTNLSRAQPRQAQGRGLLDLWNRHERRHLTSGDTAVISLDHWQRRKRISIILKAGRWMITHSMDMDVQSLNASVAAAILMYEVFRNRL